MLAFHKAESLPPIALTALERQLLKTYKQALTAIGVSLSDPEVLRIVREEITAGNSQTAASRLPWADLILDLKPIVRLLARQVAQTANSIKRELPSRMKFEGQFNATDPRALAWAEARAGRLIQAVNDETRRAIATIISDGLRTKLSIDEVVANLKTTIGLDIRSSRALASFQRKQIEQALKDGLQLPNAIARATERGLKYKDKLLTARAKRIARTESHVASQQGRVLGWVEAEGQGLMSGRELKQWITAIDERTCEVCAPMDGKVIPWKDMFILNDGQMMLMPDVHPNCRCVAVLIPEPAPDLALDFA